MKMIGMISTANNISTGFIIEKMLSERLLRLAVSLKRCIEINEPNAL
jgi:hypothetical protein